ncbi:SdpI family protein [Chitinophaga nivalis]|uniref:SdpI family protein n=1 Tax=Chitinophaga nivalis TaxID=2991709 RepID=A0ABT3IFN4_9BACT|nr:SdpI family protein [Chitinophaga nivalis]MCW3467688.1 SdpI family protein [Chitinophaga nivalis]MCW3482620.1 SdpI family protein [Chitinophaga nivalis]
MKQPDYTKEILILVLLLIPMAYLGIIWPSLPAIIPTNFNIEGVPERVGTKRDFLLLMIFLFFTNALIYFLFRYIPKEDEITDSGEVSHKEFYRIRFLIHTYQAVFTCIIIFMVSQGKPFAMERWAFIGVGLLLTAIGYYLRNLKPNNYVGVRTPWTLQSTEIWTETHRMASNLWLSAGIAVIIAGFFLSLVTGVFIIFFIAIVLAALPYIYSFRLFNKDKG